MMSLSDFYDTHYESVIKKYKTKLKKIHPSSQSLLNLLNDTQFIDDIMSKEYQDYINSIPFYNPIDDWLGTYIDKNDDM